MGWGNHHRGHKRTVYCPQDGCNYTSRQFVSLGQNNKLSNASYHCPIHQKKLVRTK